MVMIRPAAADDARFLQEMLAIAADWRPGTRVRSAEEVMSEPAFAHYLEGWPRSTDAGVVAELDGEPMGATWWRYSSPDDPGFGFVDATVPEISIGVVEPMRGRGVGTMLLDALIAEARRQHVRAISLSVEPDNPAARLYERLGFAAAGGIGGAVTMLLAVTS
jgi:GNAT superfamily N-acetyltransferase